MKLLTKEILARLPMIGEGKGIVQVKFFTPWSNWTWYATEYDPATGEMFGLVDGHEKEQGYFNIGELEQIRGHFGMKIERDMYFEPINVKELL